MNIKPNNVLRKELIDPPRFVGSRDPRWFERHKRASIDPDTIVVVASLVSTIIVLVLAALSSLPGQ